MKNSFLIFKIGYESISDWIRAQSNIKFCLITFRQIHEENERTANGFEFVGIVIEINFLSFWDKKNCND